MMKRAKSFRNNRSRKGRSKAVQMSRQREGFTIGNAAENVAANIVLYHHKYSFTNTNASPSTSFDITPAKLGALVSFGLSSTTVGQLWEQVRVKRIVIEGQANTAIGTISTERAWSCSLNVAGVASGTLGNNVLKQSVQKGMTQVPHIDFKFNDSFQGGQWQNCSTTTAPGENIIFSMTLCPAANVHIWMDGAISANERNSSFATTVTGPATVGEFYYLALDNQSGATGSVGNQLVPLVGLNTIT